MFHFHVPHCKAKTCSDFILLPITFKVRIFFKTTQSLKVEKKEWKNMGEIYAQQWDNIG